MRNKNKLQPRSAQFATDGCSEPHDAGTHKHTSRTGRETDESVCLSPKRHQKQGSSKRPGDHYYHEAKDQGFLARSVFKLKEIDDKYRLFPSNRKDDFFVIDLGCAPGSWLQYTLPKLRKGDRIVGIDLNEIDINDPKLIFIQGDILEVAQKKIMDADLVLSDMAPKTCGIKSVDQERSIELCRAAMQVAISNLRKKGNLVIKAFQSNEIKPFTIELKKYFSDVKIFKPDSSRQESFEIFIVAMGFTRS